MTGPHHLGVEHLGRAVVGLCVRRPRLSWQLPIGATGQSAYDIELDDGRGVRVESQGSVLVPWPFPPLQSRDSFTWRVRVTTDLGESDWSAPAIIEAGLFDDTDWSASWIEPDEVDRRPSGSRPAWLLRHEFTIEDVGSTARLYATAHGIYETFLNGRRVGDVELAPGFTSYDAILHVQTYDVTDLVAPGPNVWEVTLSDGWYRGRHGTSQIADGYGDTVAFLGQLEVGSRTVTTGPAWTASTGSIISADLMVGQVEDRRIQPGPWRPVVMADHGFSQLTSSPAPPVRRIQELRPTSIVQLDPARQVIDLGQNINGHLLLHDLGPAGTQVALVHGEALDRDGDVTTEPLEFDGSPLGQVDRVTSAGLPGDEFEPRHTVHGFQYVRVEGHPTLLTPADATGVVVHTDLRRTGWFRCSDERLNQFHAIADWSFRDNACDIPTDCPHRERSGWTGDWQVFVPSASFLYDVAGFSTKWLRDLAAEQMPDGLLPNYAPDPRRRRALANEDLSWFGMLGSAGWGDACVIVPWELYQSYGDREILAEMWPTMTRWLDYAATVRTDQATPGTGRAPPRPGSPRGVSLGRRLALGGVVRARDRRRAVVVC